MSDFANTINAEFERLTGELKSMSEREIKRKQHQEWLRQQPLWRRLPRAFGNAIFAVVAGIVVILALTLPLLGWGWLCLKLAAFLGTFLPMEMGAVIGALVGMGGVGGLVFSLTMPVGGGVPRG